MKTLFLLVFSLCILPIGFASAASYSSHLRRGNRDYKNELYSEALTNYLVGREKNEKAIEPDFNAACAYYQIEDYVRAIALFERSLQKRHGGEEAADIYYNMGNSYFKLGDWKKAVDSYRKGLEINSYDLALKHNLELALKKLKESQQVQKKEVSPQSGKSEEKEGKGKQNSKGSAGTGTQAEKPDERSASEESESETESDQGLKLSKEDAERLIQSLGTDQSETIGELIKSRIQNETNEKDW